MIQNLGQTIRNLRKQKGTSLQAFAEQIEVSPGYLSNLETQKTDTISLTLLAKLNEEFDLFPSLNHTTSPHHELHFRLDRMCELLKALHDTNPELAHYFISHIEEGLVLFQKE
ncbi:helix-turn-helix domain-containing protein [Bacillus sp. BP-3]|uniref:helix-turn-helix domain-containing protein n=1 Tax=Bacillus sp. BP-3 TaxID=3022773 RepID=UPI00232CCE80|nr:helix-turn-helix transcriptional regulator [Bacillus sp. BP-3]MDC2863158.1 helix-turn-helix transcriptional regulator [Bacillus sp. BP-3]